MAVKVLKIGRLPGSIKYQATCRVCQSELEWTKADAKRSFERDLRDGPCTHIDCPVCLADVKAYQSKGQ